MTTNPTGDIEPKEIIRYLVCQQFYYGDDKIYGRTKDLFEYIPKSGQVIDDFINLLLKLLQFIDKEKYQKFLDNFNTEIHPIPTDSLYIEFVKNLGEMGEFKNQILIITNILGKPLTHIHTTCFDEAVAELYLHNESKNLLNLGSIKISKEEFQKKLYYFYSRGDKNIGVIYSLSFLRFLAKKINNTEVINRTEKFLIKHYEIISDKIKNMLI
jgi:hypothetical protein